MLKIKLAFYVSIMLLITGLGAVGWVAIKVAHHRGERIEELERRVDALNDGQRALSMYLNSKQTVNTVVEDFKRDVEDCDSDWMHTAVPPDFGQLWANAVAEAFGACGPDGAM